MDMHSVLVVDSRRGSEVEGKGSGYSQSWVQREASASAFPDLANHGAVPDGPAVAVAMDDLTGARATHAKVLVRSGQSSGKQQTNQQRLKTGNIKTY